MRFFDDSKSNTKETLILMNMDEARVVYDALEEYSNNHKRSKKAKIIIKAMSTFWGIF